MASINIRTLDIDHLDEIEELNETFEKIHKGKKFDDGTIPSKNAKKKGTHRIEKELPKEEE